MSAGSFIIKLYLPFQAAAEIEATIVAWKVKVGDEFIKGDILAEVESAKAAFDYDAPCNGKVFALLCKEGEPILFEKPFLEIETSDLIIQAATPLSDVISAQSAPVLKPTALAAGQYAGTVSIIGLGGYLPDRIVKTEELIKDFTDVSYDYMLGVTGIKERRWAADDQKPSDLAYHAAVNALKMAGIKAKELNAIIVSTTTPDVAMPSTACILSNKLGVRGIPAFDINAACSGWLYGLTIGKGLICGGVGHNVLVVGVDLQSRLIDKKDKDTYFLFGDGSGAAVLSDTKKGHAMKSEILIADGDGLRLVRREYPGYKIAQNEEGIDPWIRMDGHLLFRLATGMFASIISDVVVKSGWKTEDVRWVVPHQANSRILKASARKSGIPFERYYLNIDRIGNTSSASIPLALLDISKKLQIGDKIVICSVGAGITAAAISIEW